MGCLFIRHESKMGTVCVCVRVIGFLALSLSLFCCRLDACMPSRSGRCGMEPGSGQNTLHPNKISSLLERHERRARVYYKQRVHPPPPVCYVHRATIELASCSVYFESKIVRREHFRKQIIGLPYFSFLFPALPHHPINVCDASV